MNRRTAILMSLGLSVALIAVGIWFLSDYHTNFGYGWRMPHHRMMGFGGMGMVMVVFWVAVLGAVALVVSSMLTGRGESDQATGEPLNALEILKQRYARGEIDKIQFDAMRRDIG